MTQHRSTGVIVTLLLAAATLLSPDAFCAAPQPQYVQFSGAAKGALYRPDPALFPSPHVGVIAMHRNSNYLNHISTGELSARGFVVLGMNPRCDNNEALCAPWENNALDVKQGVNYLRSLPGITKVVLLGHSGGGPDHGLLPGGRREGHRHLQPVHQADEMPEHPRRAAARRRPHPDGRASGQRHQCGAQRERGRRQRFRGAVPEPQARHAPRARPVLQPPTASRPAVSRRIRTTSSRATSRRSPTG